jgi:uncharacterized protein with NRDE domain
MCTIVLAWNAWPARPGIRLVLAANRDELRARPSAPPHLLAESPPRWGGQDLVAGGTWLSVEPGVRLAAVTNRHPGGVVPRRDPSRRSRGSLPLDLLRGDDAAAHDLLCSLASVDYNPVNLLYVGTEHAWWAAVDDRSGTRVAEVPPGVHVLGENDLDDAGPKARAIRRAAEDVVSTASEVEDVVSGLRTVLSSHERHGDGPQTAACIHEERYGTVSSSTVVFDGSGLRYHHAEGPPCTTPFLPVPVSDPQASAQR